MNSATVGFLVLVTAVGAVFSVTALSATAPTGCAPTGVVTGNAKPGGTGWTPGSNAIQPPVQGFADMTSAVCGQRVTLYLATELKRRVPVRIQAWRLGYDNGAGGRLVWTSGVVFVRRPKRWEMIAPQTLMVSAPWSAWMIFDVPHTWTQGVYELRIVPVSRFMLPAMIPLVVRDPTRTSRLVEVLSTNTWQMYNMWAGLDAYSSPKPSRVVSLNRPYNASGLQFFAADDYPLVRFVEQYNMDVSYVADVDLDRGAVGVSAVRRLIFGSHTEYWTPAMRANFAAALAKGANAVFFGANSMYWRPVSVGTTTPYRQLAIWKVQALDPNGQSPTLASVKWRDAPISQPEQRLLGEQFGCTNVLEPLTVPDPLGWLFSGSGAAPGQSVPGVIYQETDGPSASAPMPVGTRLAASMVFACPQEGLATSGSAISLTQTIGGGLVVDVGTRGWVCLLNQSCSTNSGYNSPALLQTDPDIVPGTQRNDPGVVKIIQNVTTTLLKAVTSGPAGALGTTSGYPLAIPAIGP